MVDITMMYANKQNNFEAEEPTTLKHFGPWEDHTDQNRNAASPNLENLVESPPPANYLDYWPQPVERPVTWWNWYIPYCFLVAAHPATTVWLGGATAESTPDMPQPLSVNTPTIETTVPQEVQSRRKRKREEEDEDEEDRLKVKRDERLMKRISKLSREQIEELLPYRREMARTFATKERTPAEQRKRDKNTEACRLSRRRKKLMEILKEYSSAFGV